MNSTVSLSDPQAVRIGDAVAFDDEDSVWVFPECKYNDITSDSSEFKARRACPHKNARSKIKTLPFPKTALANNRKPSEDQIRPHQSTNAEKGAFSKTKLGTEEPPTKKQKVAIPVHTFLAKDGSPPFVRTGRSTMNDTKTVPDGVDSYRLERINVRGQFREVIVLSDSDEYVSEDSDVGNTIGTKTEKKDEPQLDQHATADTVQKDANDENDDFCHVCGFGGSLYMCDGCCNSVHFTCLAEDVQEDIKALMKELKKKHKNDRFNDSFNDMPFYCNECENGFIDDENDAQVEKDTELFHEGGVLRKFRNKIIEKDNNGALKEGVVEAGWKALILGEDEEYDRVTKEITENMKDGKFDPTLYPNGGFEQRNLRQRERQVFDHYFKIGKNKKNEKANQKVQSSPKPDEIADTHTSGSLDLKPEPTANKLANNASAKATTAAALQNTTKKIAPTLDFGSMGDEFAPLDLTGEEQPKFQLEYEDEGQYDIGLDESEDLYTDKPEIVSKPILASKANLQPVKKLEQKKELSAPEISPKVVKTIEKKPNLFTCFICGTPRLPFKSETCLWYDHLSVPRKTCTSCIECVTGIEELPRLDEDGIFI